MITLSTSNQAGLANQASSAQSSTAKSIETISSGSRLARASSDIASFSIASRLKAEITHNDQAIRNAADAQSLLHTADSGLGEIQTILQELRSVSVQSMNGTYSSTDTAAMNTHAQQLLAEIDSIASSTKWAGSGLLDGNSAYLKFKTGEAATSSESLTACIPGFKSANLGLKNLLIDGNEQHSSGLKPGEMIEIYPERYWYEHRQDITKLSDGTFLMAYGTWNGVDNSSTARNIYGQIIDSNGAEIGDRVLLAEKTHSFSDPEVSSTADGGFILANSEDEKIVVGKYNAALSLENEIEIDAGGTVSGANRAPDIATLNNGNKVIAYFSGTPGADGSISVQIVNGNGQAVGDPTIVFTQGANDDYDRYSGRPAVTNLSDGGFMVVAERSYINQSFDTDMLIAQRFDADGNKVGTEIEIFEYATEQHTLPTATTLSNNQIVVAWTQEVKDGFTTEHHIKAQLFDIDGTKIGSTIDVNTGVVKDGDFDGSVLPIVTELEGNDFLISWSGMSPDLNGINEYPGKILMQRFNACGVKQGSEILLDTEQPNNRLAGYLAAEKKDDGNILLSWGNSVENLLYAQSISPYETGESSKLNMIDDAIAYIVQHRAALGAKINRLSSAISNLTTLSHNKKASLGTVADADMATEVTQLAKSQLLAQASVAMTAQANNSMYEVLKLIKD